MYIGGINRLKNHLTGRSGNVKTFTEFPKEVREELWAIFNEKQHKDVATYQTVVQDARDILGDSDLEGEINEGLEETTQTASSDVRRRKKGHIDLIYRKPETARKPEKAEDGSSSSTKGKEKVLVEVVEEVDEGVDEEMEHGQSEKEAVTFECNDSNQEEIEGYVVEFAVVEDDVGEEEEDI
ncbi:hypothetical protein TanjilG_24834 [Lupinus angustifolius]|uniref:BED-type domain-containing protein n=1 Tax=Lupinus angustifolius TaxID=3871 RepID=A0A1J7HGZ3_LUPAN|nr:hypothetical protein TanjilG_24834 [Lupinus angustifolius]